MKCSRAIDLIFALKLSRALSGCDWNWGKKGAHARRRHWCGGGMRSRHDAKIFKRMEEVGIAPWRPSREREFSLIRYSFPAEAHLARTSIPLFTQSREGRKETAPQSCSRLKFLVS